MITQRLVTLPLCWALVGGDKPVVIPAIREWTESNDGSFTYDVSKAHIIYDAALFNVAQLFKYDFATRSSQSLPIVEESAQKPSINDFYFKIETDENELVRFGEEGYKLEIGDKITITAKTEIGYRRGSMTLLQLAGSINVPWGIIYDYPESEKRWLSLDCARHFFQYGYIRNLIKTLAFYKMNGLILHCVDAEAFRFEAVSHPDLAIPGGYYTKEQIIDFVQLGEDYGVDIIPGFEFPGHSTVFNVAFGTGLPSECEGAVYPWVTKDWIMDITTRKSVEITQEVLTDVLRWFPSPYVHLGADELPDITSKCEPVRAYLDDNPQFGSYGDIIANWISNLGDWVNTTLGKKPIIYNGMEKEVRKIEVPKNSIIQFWDQDDGDAYLTDYYLANNYKILNSYPAKEFFYLTPNAYHYIFPKLAALMEKGVAAALPPKAKVEGYVFNIWCDYLYWLEDIFIEEHAALPRAMIAAMSWNMNVSQYPDPDEFQRALNSIGPAPGLNRLPHSYDKDAGALIELHHWSFEPAEYEASVAKSCPDPLCLFIRDNVGTLHGSTYIADPAANTNLLVRGKYGRALQWNECWGKEGVGFGGEDIPAPWTWSAWIRLDEKRETMPLFWSRQGALMLGTPDDGKIGVATFPDMSSVLYYNTGASFPEDRNFHHLVFTATKGETADVGRVDVYLDGVQQDSMTLDLDLPMAAIMGFVPLDADGPTQTLMTLDEVRVLHGYSLQEDVDRLKSLPPAVAFNNPPDMSQSNAETIYKALAVMTACILFPLL